MITYISKIISRNVLKLSQVVAKSGSKVNIKCFCSAMIRIFYGAVLSSCVIA